MKNETEKSKAEIRLDKQGEKLRENLKKRRAWQLEHDRLKKESLLSNEVNEINREEDL